MSDNWITIIPEDPAVVPGAVSQARARAWFERMAPNAEKIVIETSKTVEFFDCGANFERILCPSCNAEISVEWWQQRMGEDYEEGFKLQKYPAPCCGVPHTLHQLHYEWPQGFGRFAVTVMNPRVGELGAEQIRELEREVECKMRIIYQHL